MAQEDRREYDRKYYLSHKERKAAYLRQYYQNNSERMIENALERQRRSRDFIQHLKIGLSCKRCGIDDWRVLDFHHLDRQTKEASINGLTRTGASRERILREIAKCEVLCSNCHRILHWKERYGDED